MTNLARKAIDCGIYKNDEIGVTNQFSHFRS